MADHSPVEQAAALLAGHVRRGRQTLSEPDAKALLKVLGIPVPQGIVVQDAAGAVSAAEAIGPPVAVKAVAFNLTHKSEAGGVICPVDTPAAAGAACGRIAADVRRARPDIALEGFLVEAYRPAAPEWILGLRVDPQFGPAIMLGLGGVHVDILQEVSFRLAPLRERDIEDLLSECRATRILDGVRGRPPADRDALKAAIRLLSNLAARPDIARSIAEIEINPLAINERGVLALDALVVLSLQGDRT